MQTSNVTSKGQVTIPAAQRRRLGIVPGGKVRFVPSGNKLLVEVVKQPPASTLFGVVKAAKGRRFANADDAVRQALDKRTREIMRKGRG